ncbi:hypothetical protein ACFWCB_22670 [Streptomyces sp. NPDC060048]|uniref:glycine-rich domain-containing protein n=1 Tax=unclassified Streptomyces TaxID=2593676 RepID=UPI003684D6F8
MKLLSPSRSAGAALVLAVAAVPLLAAPSSAGPAPVVKAFNSPGVFEFEVPDGVTSIRVTAVAGGGGGGGGGGNNNGPLTGGGGGGGASGSVVSCTIEVGSGLDLQVMVAKGGAPGKGGGRNQNGAAGGTGGDSGVAVEEDRVKPVVTISGGLGGSGGKGVTPLLHSGSGGAGGTASLDTFCDGSDPATYAGKAGDKGDDGRKNSYGVAGHGAFSPKSFDQCVGAGHGSNGGSGAAEVITGNDSTTTHQAADDGEKGAHGCVILTYTAP